MSYRAIARSRSTLSVPAEDLTGDALELDLPADASFEGVSNSIARIVVDPNDNITSDDFTLEVNLMPAGGTATVVAATDLFTTSAVHGLAVGDEVRFETSGTLPSPLVAGTSYYVHSTPAANTLKITDVLGGSVLNIADAGTGTHSWQGFTKITTAAPYGYPAAPVLVREKLDGRPGDFTLIRVIHFWAVAKDSTQNASGSGWITLGDSTDTANYFAAPWSLAYTAGDDPEDKVTPAVQLVLPEGLTYDASFPLQIVTKAGESNSNLRLFLNLAGN